MEDRINLNGEFLGISALAIYSAPWYLQIPLLALVALMFMSKVARNSKEIKAWAEQPDGEGQDELDEFLSDVNRAFFGFAVRSKNLAAYWTGFAIFLITLVFAVYNFIANIAA